MPLLDETGVKLTLDPTQFVKGIREGIAALVEAIKQSTLLKQTFQLLSDQLAKVGAVFANVAPIQGFKTALTGILESTKSVTTAIAAFATSTKIFDSLAPLVAKVSAALSAMAAAATPAFKNIVAQVKEYVDVVNTAKAVSFDAGAAFGQASVQIATAGEIVSGTAGHFFSFRTILVALGEYIAPQFLGILANLATSLSETLSPSLTHMTGTVQQQTEAMRHLGEEVKTFALAFEKGQQEALGPFTDAVASISAALIPTNKAFVESVGFVSAAAASFLSLAGQITSTVASYVLLAQVVSGLKFVLNLSFIQTGLQNLGIITRPSAAWQICYG